VSLLLAFDVITILPIAIFGAFAAAAWWVMDAFSSRRPRAEERLAELKTPGQRKPSGNASDAMAKLLERATPKFAKPLQPKTQAEASKLKSRLTHAGFRRESAPGVFLGLKLILLIVGVVVGGGSMVALTGLSKSSLMRTVMIAGGLFYIPDLLVWFIAKKRKQAIFLSLPDTLDLMVVCVEAGLGLDQAMRRVAEEMQKTYRIICAELSLCNFQLQMGKSRNEVLHELGERTGVDDLRALASILIQADKFGSSIGKALRVQSDSMRTRRRQLAEEKAAKTAVQLIFPLVLFIFPGIFVVLVGPAAITMIREMFPMMQGNG
jgi:tight adherence protein C